MEIVKILNKSTFDNPTYATEHSSGVDLKAFIEEPINLKPLERKLIPTGLFIELPVGIEAQIRPRSGMALKKGLSILNTPGTIDSDYRGEIGVIVVNLSNDIVTIEPGERICQMVFTRYEKVSFENVNKISETDRGAGGFGSTGHK
ncbi:MAG: dUTP diphosphatase [Tenuifilum sp.]|uniref:dUTP diphosphatase n=1 Tax=Tenuifilum sp. TaxID=2760880 RepID=UPI001B651DF4|nr:dUTP diphosphatase [Bacteroidales bacterium]HOK60567.1 dUTP diphosphatase [Tenuifilum sp.]MBP9028212.1 dUTP diphosphatase [Bacteroidales bacterium]HOK85126.1 dUTP diphosphatase [Tenuifilum sp.]HOU73291.1 dUTP diphosphatase [Tenuifilum sp.]